MTDAQISRASAEILIQSSGAAQVSRISAEALVQTSGQAQLSRMSAEALIQTPGSGLLSSLSAQYIISKITSTSFVDDFDRIDSTSTPGGLWQVLAGTWGLASNQLYNAGNTTGALAVLETTDTTGLITYVAPVVGTTAVAFWVVDTSNYYRYDLSTGNLIKKSSGTDTTLATSSIGPATDNSVIYVSLDATNTITVSHGQQQAVSYTDASATTGTKQGVSSNSSTGKGNHFGWQNSAAVTAAGGGWGQIPLK